jgi:phosphohistidine phosphatase
MTRTLIIMRHAKSDWDGGVESDYARPLAARGRRDAPRMGRWLRKSGHGPDFIVASPATRARQTAVAVVEALRDDALKVQFDEKLYAADLDTLLAVLGGLPRRARTVLLIGHNPGLEELLVYLAGARPSAVRAEKLMPTGAVAGIAMPDDWRALKSGCGDCRWTMRPRQLDDEDRR